HYRRNRQVDITRPGRNDQHLAETDDDVECGKLQCNRQHAASALPRDGDGHDQPHRQCRNKHPNPGLVRQPGVDCPQPHDFFPPSTRVASTRMRIAPCTASCQSVETLKNDIKAPVSNMMSAPTTAPTGDTMPPKNSPPPTITAAIDTSVYCAPTVASPDVV